jgi:Trk K+ transport system NAD-binding subunit
MYPVVPILGVITTWMFVPALEPRSFALGGALTLVGMGVYFIRPANRADVAELRGLFARIRLWLRLKRKAQMRVLIIDGGPQGQNIARRLLARDEFRLVFRSAEHQVTFVERDEALCHELEQQFNAPIYQGDGAKREILEQVGADNVDVAIAASDDDGRNVIVALQAKRLGMDPVIAVVQDPEYVELLEEKGIAAISAPWATAAMVENYLDRPGVADLFEIGTGVASLVSVVVPEGAQVTGKKIREIDVPRESVVAAIIRGEKYVVPRGDTEVQAGDQVIFVGPTSSLESAQSIFRLAT